VRNKHAAPSSNFQAEPTFFKLEHVAGRNVVLDFSAPKISSVGGLTLINQYEQKKQAFLIELSHA